MFPTSEGVNGVFHQHDEKINITQEEINELPLKAFEGKIVLVSNEEAVSKAFKEVAKHSVVGFDTETRPSFHKGQHYDVALLQIALANKVFLVRLNDTGITQDIVEFFENKDILKVGVGVRDDIRVLQKLNKFKAEGFTELTTLAKEVGLQVESVKKLTALLLGFRISKSAQTSNWEAAVLNEKQVSYAATDAWVCLEIYKKMLSKKKLSVKS
ncbi:MAG TPA: 3'-5' exonuclease [Cyclobacteriaceae bacterium]|nr:3'-5' exonuclease [Cyclobacteriaceae bacterium]